MQVFLSNTNNSYRISPHGVMAYVRDYSFEVSEFEHQSSYYVHFRTNTLGKGMNSLIPPAMS